MGERPSRYVWREQVFSVAGPSSSARLVAAAFCEYVNELDGVGKPGAAALARRSGLSERTVVKARQELVEKGWLVLVSEGGVAGGTKTSHYRISTPVDKSSTSASASEVTSADIAEVPARPLQLVHPTSANGALTSATASPESYEPVINQKKESSPVDKVRAELRSARETKQRA